jgi:hypothetical protein
VHRVAHIYLLVECSKVVLRFLLCGRHCGAGRRYDAVEVGDVSAEELLVRCGRGDEGLKKSAEAPVGRSAGGLDKDYDDVCLEQVR